MHLIIGVLALIGMLVVAPLWRRYKLRRANANFQHSIWVYDEARRKRIQAGADPRSISTAEENLIATGFGAQVGKIERLPRPDPVIGPWPAAATADSAYAPPTSRAPAATAKPIVPAIPLSRPQSSTPAIQAPVPASSPRPMAPGPQIVPPMALAEPMDPAVVRPDMPAIQMPASFTPLRPPPDAEGIRPAVPMAPVRITAVRPATPSLKYELTYVTERGELTERRIRLKRAYSQHGEVYVEAHCYLRRDERTFRADRMSDLVEVDIDSPIPDPVAHFLGFIEPEEIVTPGHELVMAKAKPGLLAMIWVGRAGGDLDPDTVAMLGAFCSDRAQLNRGAIDFKIRLAERWITDQRPTFEIASGSLARIKRGGPEWGLVHDRTREVASLRDTDKRSKRFARLFRG